MSGDDPRPGVHLGIDPAGGWTYVGRIDGADIDRDNVVVDEVAGWADPISAEPISLTFDARVGDLREIFAGLNQRMEQVAHNLRVSYWGLTRLRNREPVPSGRRPYWIKRVDWAAQRRIDTLRRRRRRRGQGRPGTDVERRVVIPRAAVTLHENDRLRFRAPTTDARDAVAYAFDALLGDRR